MAEQQQEKNAKLREAFGISEYFVDGTSFDPNKQAKEQLARQEHERQKALEKAVEKEQQAKAARYELVQTPSPEPPKPKKKKRKSRERYVLILANYGVFCKLTKKKIN